MLPFSEACERNKGPILEILTRAMANSSAVLEIGSGTGQHAVHFARHLAHLTWQPTERAENLPWLAARVAEEGPSNLRPPLELDVAHRVWPAVACDVVFSANTLHIMSWPEVEAFFRGIGRVLGPGGRLVVYGPFRRGGAYTSDSNALFDQSLRARDPESGLRDLEAVDRLAAGVGLGLEAHHPMPANNDTLVWRRTG